MRSAQRKRSSAFKLMELSKARVTERQWPQEPPSKRQRNSYLDLTPTEFQQTTHKRMDLSPLGMYEFSANATPVRPPE